jgi:hypothetical protein
MRLPGPLHMYFWGFDSSGRASYNDSEQSVKYSDLSANRWLCYALFVSDLHCHTGRGWFPHLAQQARCSSQHRTHPTRIIVEAAVKKESASFCTMQVLFLVIHLHFLTLLKSRTIVYGTTILKDIVQNSFRPLRRAQTVLYEPEFLGAVIVILSDTAWPDATEFGRSAPFDLPNFVPLEYIKSTLVLSQVFLPVFVTVQIVTKFWFEASVAPSAGDCPVT